MGHSVLRPAGDSSNALAKVHKRLELLPEEALYLVERGSMFCWKSDVAVSISCPGLEEMEGAPITVQQAFSEMVGTEGLTLEKYQVRRF